MSISFQCPRCGKKLKAPDSAAGKASKCPGCGGTVTCPEAGDDGEVVEMQLAPTKPKGFDPFADMEGGKTSGVTSPAASAQPRDEEFEPPLKRAGKPKSGKGKKKAGLRSIALYQRRMLLCILGNIVAYVGCLASLRLGVPALAVLLGIVLLVTSLAATVFCFLLTKMISNVGMAILVLILSLVPCAGLIALLVVNGIATNRLKDKGISVGFLGADMSEFG